MNIIRSYIGEAIAAAIGMALGLSLAASIWDRVVPPPRCDGGPLPGGGYVIPTCVSHGPPLWLAIPCLIVGAASSIALYRFTRSKRNVRRFPSVRDVQR